jgi:hypothetical protein
MFTAVCVPLLFGSVFAQVKTASSSSGSSGPQGGPNKGGNAIAAYVFGDENAKNAEDLADAIVTNLANSAKYSQPRGGARQFFAMADREQRKHGGKLLSDRDFCRIGGDFGVNFLCIIDIEKAGRGNSVWARILDLTNCSVVATSEFTGLIRNSAEVTTAANNMTTELLKRNIGKRSIGGGSAVSTPTSNVTPTPAVRGNQIGAYVFGSENAKLGEDLAQYIVDGLSNSKKYSAPRRGAKQFYAMCDQQQRRKGGALLGDRDFCKIGSDFEIEYLCIIDIEKAGRGNSVWARILDLDNCKIIATAESTALIRNDAEANTVANQIVTELLNKRIGNRSIHGGGGGGGR